MALIFSGKTTCPASHEFIEHTGEMALRIRAPSFAALAAEAGRGLTGVLRQGGTVRRQGPSRSFEVKGSDRAALLVNWLNEIIYFAETERWVPTTVEAELTGETVLQLTTDGVTL